MNKTAIIMSHDEAMALPLAERPLNYRISSEMYHAVFDEIGYASLCWEPKPTGVFDSTKASDAAVKLCFKIAEELEVIKAKHDKVTDMVSRFCVAWKGSLPDSWMEGFIECGAITHDPNYPTGFIAPVKLL